MKKTLIAALVMISGLAMADGTITWRESVYRNDSVTCTGAVTAITLDYTNATPDRVALASVFANCNYATNTFGIAVVNGGQTNKIATDVTANNVTANAIKYDGTGNIPLGVGGMVRITLGVSSNATASVQWQVHTK